MAIKIVLFIVEGSSDEETLSTYITKLIFKNRKILNYDHYLEYEII